MSRGPTARESARRQPGRASSGSRLALAAVLLVAAGCLRTADERALLDLEVGRASAGGVSVTVADGLAAVRELAPGRLELWAQAPVLHVSLEADATAPAEWLVVVRNALGDAELVGTSGSGTALAVDAEAPGAVVTRRSWRVTLVPGETAELTLAPPDAGEETPWRFAVLSDIQEAVDRVQDVFSRIDADETIRFVVSAGDLTERGTREELVAFQGELERLDVPFYATLGNHDIITGQDEDWHELYGRHSFHFTFRGVAFTFADSSTATIDPMVYERLEDWLASAREADHVFLTHIPPFDPVGVRNGAFRSRNEAAMLINRLAEGEVDLALYGHIHTYVPFSNGGIPAHISGGGGAIPERGDGIGRHFLTVDTSVAGDEVVGLVRID